MTHLTEAWGFKNGETVELRTVVGAYPGCVGTLEGGREWHRVTIVAITADKGIVVKLPTGRSKTIYNPKVLRHRIVPSTVADIAKFLGE